MQNSYKLLPPAVLAVCALAGCNNNPNLNAGVPVLQVSPESVDFGEVVQTTIATSTIMLHNAGYGDLTFDSVALDPSSDPVFEIISAPELAIGHNEDGLLSIRYSPDDEGQDVGKVLLTLPDSEEPPVEVTLEGLGTKPCIDVEPHSLNFGVVVADATVGLPLEIGNACTGELLIYNLQFPSTEGIAYSIELPDSWLTPMALGGGASQKINVNFQPPTADAWNGELWINSNDPENPLEVVQLQGNMEDTPENSPPSVEILDPNNGQYFLDSQTIALNGHVVDDDPASSLACVWYADDRYLGGLPAASDGSINFSTTLEAADYQELRLRCTDPGGAYGEDTAVVSVWPADEPTTYTISGGSSIYSFFGVDDDLELYLNGSSDPFYRDQSGHSGTLPPVDFDAVKFDTIRIVAIDRNPCASELDTLVLHWGTTDSQTLNDPICVSSCEGDPCNDGSYNETLPNTFYDQTFTINIP